MAFQNRSFIYGLLVGSSAYAALKWIHDYMSKKQKNIHHANNDCFLFSPNSSTFECLRQSGYCKLLFCAFCNFKKFINLIKSAKTTLDVCVYLITSEEVSKVIISLFKKGVRVRIIMDKQMSDEAHNSKVYCFVKEFIPVKVVDTGEMMHNKFVIIDQKKLITGSFNWTKQDGLFKFRQTGRISSCPLCWRHLSEQSVIVDCLGMKEDRKKWIPEILEEQFYVREIIEDIHFIPKTKEFHLAFDKRVKMNF